MLYKRVVVVICAFGILGNALNLIVLTERSLQKQVRTPGNQSKLTVGNKAEISAAV